MEREAIRAILLTPAPEVLLLRVRDPAGGDKVLETKLLSEFAPQSCLDVFATLKPTTRRDPEPEGPPRDLPEVEVLVD